MTSGLFVPHIYEEKFDAYGRYSMKPPWDGGNLVEETIRTHHGVADAIEVRNPTAAHDAMYLHLVYNRNMIAEGTQTKGI